LIALAAAILLPVGAIAQAPAPSATAPNAQLLKPAELDQLVAPIALYPDPLLAQVLMASAYPLDIVQAGGPASSIVRASAIAAIARSRTSVAAAVSR